MFRRGCKTPVNQCNQSCGDSCSPVSAIKRPLSHNSSRPLESSIGCHRQPPFRCAHGQETPARSYHLLVSGLRNCIVRGHTWLTRHLSITHAPSHETAEIQWDGPCLHLRVIICGKLVTSKGRQSNSLPCFASDQGEIINYPPCLRYKRAQSYELSHLTATLFRQLNWLNKTMVRTIRAKKKRQ